MCLWEHAKESYIEAAPLACAVASRSAQQLTSGLLDDLEHGSGENHVGGETCSSCSHFSSSLCHSSDYNTDSRKCHRVQCAAPASLSVPSAHLSAFVDCRLITERSRSVGVWVTWIGSVPDQTLLRPQTATGLACFPCSLLEDQLRASSEQYQRKTLCGHLISSKCCKHS